MKITDLYIGEYRECPKCKGTGKLEGQQVEMDNKTCRLPNYKHVKSGDCFLCNKTGEVFFSIDNRVLKLSTDKYGKPCVCEYSNENGFFVRIIYNNELLSSSNISKCTDDYVVKEEDLFPERYEFAWGDWSRVADIILEEYPNSKPIFIDRYFGIEEGEETSIGFLHYYDKNGKFIKPYYINPPHDLEDYAYKGIIHAEDIALGVSGIYFEDSKKMVLGVKYDDKFSYYNLKNISLKADFEINQNQDINMIIENIASLVLKDVYSII